MSARRSETAILFRALAVASCALAGSIAHAQGPPSGKGSGGTYYPGPPTAPPVAAPASPPPGQYPGQPGANPGQPAPGAAGAASPAGVASSPAAPSGEPRPEQIDAQVIEIRLVGNRHVTRTEIVSKMRTKAGRPFDQSTLEKDVRALATWGKFIDVKTRKEPVPGGVIITIEVIERPTLEYVKFLGHKKVGRMSLAKQVDLKKGSPLEPYAIEEGKRKLEEYYRGKGFNDVYIKILEGTQPNDHGAVYLIHEGPPQKVAKVHFVGNTIATDGRLKTQIQSKPPILWLFKGEVDRKKIDEDIERLTAYYRGLGFFRAHVGRELEWNETEDRLQITFVIDEGPRAKVRSVKILGNTKFSFAQLSPGLELKPSDWFDQTKLTKDVTTLRDLYGGQGYVFCDVQPETRVLEDATALDMVYSIREGDRYRVSRINVHIESTDSVYPHTSQRTVLNRLSLHPGDIIDVNKLRQSERRLKASRLFASDPSKGRPPTIVFTAPDGENPDGSGDNVARKPKRRRSGSSSGSFRGQSPDPDDPEDAPESRGGFWRLLSRPKPADAPPKANLDKADDDATDADEEPLPQWKRIDVEMEPVPTVNASAKAAAGPAAIGSAARPSSGAAQIVAQPARPGQPGAIKQTAALIPASAIPAGSGGAAMPVAYLAPAGSPQTATSAAAAFAPPLEGAGSAAARLDNPAPFGAAGALTSNAKNSAASNASAGLPQLNPNFGPAAPKRYTWFAMMGGATGWLDDLQPRSVVYIGPDAPGLPVFRGQDPGSGVGGPGIGAPGVGGPGGIGVPGAAPGVGSLPGPVSPIDETPTREIPLDVYATETQTGRLMFGAGINSNAGLVGNVTIDEQNFDWRRIPTSYEDWHNGTAFRGAGQRFNITASPGTLLQRYSVSFSEPYLWDTPVSFGLSGAYFQRYYQNWTEQRSGGRIATGYQITPDLSGSVAFSGDDVKISNPSNPSEPQLQRVLGHTALLGVTLALTYDTRDNTFLATQGAYISGSFEECFGTFVFPRAVLDMRRFFTLHQRPDGSGRHVLAVSGLLGAEGNNASLYEHFFAGGIGTIRGFYYRGASPVDQGVIVGGTTEAIASIEYVFPITADDMLRGTTFVDMGVIEPGFTYQPSSIRLAPGIGILINVPALGPAPINVGIAVPVMRNPNDTLQYFYFSMGFGL